MTCAGIWSGTARERSSYAKGKGKITVILTTHYMEEAEALSDRIGIMKDGRLLVVGTARELMDKTNTDKFEQAFISIVKGVSL